jgi:spoIIIJ-associated protein
MGFLKNLFGGSKASAANTPEELVNESVLGLLDKAGLNLSFDLKTSEEDNNYVFEFDFFGEDEDLMKEKDGQLLDAIQLFATRVLQHHFSDARVTVNVDCNGFREETLEQLKELAEKLKNVALEKGRSVYFRALPPKDRKVVHQYLADDDRIKSRSVGEGHFKKIKIFPIANNK